jgi:putative ABC transport system permease protein
MNIFNMVTLQGMKKSRTRTIVTIFGVILSAAMITAVATFAVSLQNYMVNGAIVKYGDWHVGFVDADASFAEARARDAGVADTAVFENIGYARLEGGKNEEKPYLFIAGFSEEAFDRLPVSLVSGRLPANSSEILVSASVAANGGVAFKVGDSLSLPVGSRKSGSATLSQSDPYRSGADSGTAKETWEPHTTKAYTVVGFCQRPSFEERSAPGYTLITKADAQSSTDSYSVFVTLKNPRGVQPYANQTAGNHAFFFNDQVLRFMGASGDDVFNMLLYTVGSIVIAIIMTGSIFLIYNAFTISLNERTRQFGILSSVGATGKQLRNSVLFEGVCIGAVGIPVGVGVGIGSIGLVISVVSGQFANILYANVPLTLTVSIPAIAGAAAVSMITILISAYIPARKATRMPVMESIRQTNAVKVEAQAVQTSMLAQRIYGLEGTLALKNFKRNKKRYRSIVLSLILSVVLFISANAFVTYMKLTSERAATITSYDIGFATQSMSDGEMLPLYDKLKAANGVYESSYQALMRVSLAAQTKDLSGDYREYAGLHAPDDPVQLPMDLQFLDEDAYLQIIRSVGLPADEYTGPDAKWIAVAKMTSGKGAGWEQEVNQLPDLFMSSSLEATVTPELNGEPIPAKGQTIRLTFVGTVPPDTLPVTGTVAKNPFFLQGIAPYSLMERFDASGTGVVVKGLTFRSKHPAQTASEMEMIIQGAGVTAGYTLHNTYNMLDENRNLIFITNVFAYTFIMMISLIAVANVFNTISTNIKLRRRELAMLRSVGMSERSFQRMMNFECAFYGMRALLFGLPAAVFASWLIYRGMFIGGADNIDFVFPWSSIGISVLSVLLIVFVTMLYAVSKIKKENIIDALRDDMT